MQKPASSSPFRRCWKEKPERQDIGQYLAAYHPQVEWDSGVLRPRQEFTDERLIDHGDLAGGAHVALVEFPAPQRPHADGFKVRGTDSLLVTLHAFFGRAGRSGNTDSRAPGTAAVGTRYPITDRSNTGQFSQSRQQTL